MGAGAESGSPLLRIRLQHWCTDNHYSDVGRPGPWGYVDAFLITNFIRPEPSADASQIRPAWKLRIFSSTRLAL
jgi:hypothetical protein